MIKLDDGLVIKSSIEDKIEEFNKNTDKIANELFANNEEKNNALKRIEGIYSSCKVDNNTNVLEIYNTGISVIRYISHPNLKGCLINFISKNYVDDHKVLEFEHNNKKYVFTVFNKIIVIEENDPIFIIDDPNNVRELLSKLLFEKEIKKYTESISDRGIATYTIDVLPEILSYKFERDNSRDNIKIKFV